MRLAMVPNVGIALLKSDNDYGEVERIIQYCAQKYDDMFFYIVLSERWREQLQDGDLPRTKVVWLNKDGDFMHRHSCIDSKFAKCFNVRGGKYLVDCIYSTRLFEGMHISQLLTDYRTSHYIPVVLATIAPWDYGTFSENRFRPIVQYDLSTAASYALCNPVFYGVRDYEDGLAYVKHCLSPYFVKQFKETSMCANVSLSIPEMDEIIKSTKKYKKFTLYYGTRFATVKQVDKVMKVYEQLYSSGMNVDIIFTTQTRKKSVLLKKYVQETLKKGSIKYLITDYGKFRYMREAARGHVFMAASLDENASGFIIEQVYLGLVGVLPNRKWVFESFPRDYPFLWNNLQEAYAMIKWIYENYNEAKIKMEPYRKMIKETHASDNMLEGQVDHIRKVAFNGMKRNRIFTEGKRGLEYKSKLWKEVQNFVITEYDENAIRLQTFLKVVNKRFTGFDTKQLEIPGGPVKGIPNKLMFKHMLEKMGYRDNCMEAEPVFERVVKNE